MRYIIFSDLDGTLLNHDDYRFDDASEMLEYIKKRQIPLIFTTSKTRKECQILQNKMGLEYPFIIENGAAIVGVGSDDKVIGVGYEKIREFILGIKDEYRLKPFCDMSANDVMEWTGFSRDDAMMAKNREFSEPFLIDDERRLTQLEKIAEQEGLKILKGGRFYHLVGINQDKGVAVKKCIELIGKNARSVGLGDNYNDIDMLRVVDIPILIPHHQNRFIDLELDGLIRADFMGAKGWNEALKKVLKDG